MKKIKQWSPFIIAITAVVIFASTATWYELYRAVGIENGLEEVAIIESEDEAVPLPQQLVIRKIGVDIKVQSVGRTKAGAMGVPTNFYEAGWYNRGPKPGEEGSAVIAGHVDNALGLSGVFKNLDSLSEGDSIYVENASGARKHFIVKRVATYPYEQVPTRELFDKQGGKYLNLITCAGVWVQKKKTYSERFVVYAELVK